MKQKRDDKKETVTSRYSIVSYTHTHAEAPFFSKEREYLTVYEKFRIMLRN